MMMERSVTRSSPYVDQRMERPRDVRDDWRAVRTLARCGRRRLRPVPASPRERCSPHPGGGSVRRSRPPVGPRELRVTRAVAASTAAVVSTPCLAPHESSGIQHLPEIHGGPQRLGRRRRCAFSRKSARGVRMEPCKFARPLIPIGAPYYDFRDSYSARPCRVVVQRVARRSTRSATRERHRRKSGRAGRRFGRWASVAVGRFGAAGRPGLNRVWEDAQH